jgi:hypothetical protein
VGSVQRLSHDAVVPSRIQKTLRPLGEPQAGVGDDQPHVSEAALLEMLEEGAPAGPVLLGALADAENLPIVLAVPPIATSSDTLRTNILNESILNESIILIQSI